MSGQEFAQGKWNKDGYFRQILLFVKQKCGLKK